MTDKPRNPAFDFPCSVCHAPPGEGCRDDDGVPQPMISMHMARLIGGLPLTVRHTGRYTEDGGGIFETVDADEVKP